MYTCSLISTVLSLLPSELQVIEWVTSRPMALFRLRLVEINKLREHIPQWLRSLSSQYKGILSRYIIYEMSIPTGILTSTHKWPRLVLSLNSHRAAPFWKHRQQDIGDCRGCIGRADTLWAQWQLFSCRDWHGVSLLWTNALHECTRELTQIQTHELLTSKTGNSHLRVCLALGNPQLAGQVCTSSGLTHRSFTSCVIPVCSHRIEYNSHFFTHFLDHWTATHYSVNKLRFRDYSTWY